MPRFQELNSFLHKQVCVITNEGRNIFGVLQAVDGVTNLVLSDSVERFYQANTKKAVQSVELGLYLVKGESVSLVGEVGSEDN